MNTIQEYFDRTVAYFSRENAVQAIGNPGSCQYLTEDGNCCAIGCHIPPSLYDPAFERMDLHNVLEAINVPDPGNPVLGKSSTRA